ncbi:MAG: hypothetical protein OSA89_05645 [Mariniblastus sp.]|nr:hypothetical protein [Mariniblastus sp.]
MPKTYSDRLNRLSNLRWIPIVLVFALTGCGQTASPGNASSNVTEQSKIQAASQADQLTKSRISKYKSKLSDYQIFQMPMGDLKPASEVIEYDLNTPLFSDYSQKQRLIKLPAGARINYKPQGPLDFPVGTIIAKTFYYSADLSNPASPRQLVETRIMEHQSDGWVGIPYLWNSDQSDAELAITGATVDVEWIHSDGKSRTNSHVVPNLNDCKRCHTDVKMHPLGPKAANLNRDIAIGDSHDNQLEHWNLAGLIDGLPELSEVPKLAVWNDQSTGSLDHRARAYLEVNCGHCHNPIGPARNSGLHLNIEETNPYHLGTFKIPVAAGKGTGGRLYGIVPGKPDESILEYRLRTTKSGEIMPEFGKSLVHDEGLALIRDWIAEMKPN